MAIKCEAQTFKIHKLAFEKEGFRKYGAWTGFKNKAGEWHDVYVSLLLMGDKAALDLPPRSRIKVSGSMSHYKDPKLDGTFFEGWTVFVDDCEVVQMGDEQGVRNQQGQRQRPQQNKQTPFGDDDLGPAFPSEATGMDDVPF